MTQHRYGRWVDWRWAIAFILYIGLLVIISVLAYHRQLPTTLTVNDKLGHFVLFGLAGLLSHQALRQRGLRLGPLILPLGPLLVSLLVIVDELLQSLSPNRSAGLDDLLANWIGIVVFVAVGNWLITALARSSTANRTTLDPDGTPGNPPSNVALPPIQPLPPLRSAHTFFTFIARLLYRRTVTVLAVLMMAGAIAAIWNMSDLSTSLIRSQALQNAQLYAQGLLASRSLYSDIVINRLGAVHGMSLNHTEGYTDEDIPIPATFLIDLGQRLQADEAMTVRLYSDYPFPWREAEGGARDQFERDAIDYLETHSDDMFTRIESYNGRQSLRYAQADIMQQSCLDCHNSRLDSPRHGWKLGDVRGVLEIITPLDEFTQQTQGRLQSTLLTMILLSALGLSGLALVMGRLRQYSNDLELQVVERTRELQLANQQLGTEKEKSEQLLLNILPEPIAQRLKESPNSIADGFPEVTILFADIVGFTTLSAQLPPAEVVDLLNQIFSEFDALTDRYHLEKIKTIGDSYMVAGGLPSPRPDHTEAIANLSLDMVHQLQTINQSLSNPLSMRIGIHTGPVVAGVIGTKKFIYDLWGDTVNLASRMESHGQPGTIQVSQAVRDRLQATHILEPRGIIDIKGKGEMATYWLRDRKDPN
ncbi:MAG: VanZ family protein [Leptolyngbyaceae cyanobacterium]